MKRLTNAQLRATRYAYGLSGTALAARLGVRDDTLHRWESGRDPVPYAVRDELIALGDQLIIEINDAKNALKENPMPATTGTARKTTGPLGLTLTTVVTAPDLIRNGRHPWTGTIAEALRDIDDTIQANVLALVRDRGALPADDEDAEPADLADHIGLLTRNEIETLFDDPNITVHAGGCVGYENGCTCPECTRERVETEAEEDELAWGDA